MTGIEKTVVEQALQLSPQVKLDLAEQLIESLDATDLDNPALLTGARLAEARIEACRRGEMETYNEDEILRLLDEDPS